MLWFKLSATFHEHPKMLAVRKAAGLRADSAELGWYRLLMVAKRYGRWTFASEDHLEHVAGSFYRFVPLYRDAHLLDGLIVHDGDSYNAIRSPAERKADQRERDSMSQIDVTNGRDTASDIPVTLEREEREERKNTQREGDEPYIEAWLMAKHRLPTVRQREFMDRYLQVFDVTGPQRMAGLILRHPDDPIAALKADLDTHREERLGEIAAWEKPALKPKPKREPWQEMFRASVEAQEAAIPDPMAAAPKVDS